MFHHHFQAIAGIEQSFSQPLRRKPFLAGEILENIFHAMGEVRDARDAGNVRGSLDGMRNTLRLTDVIDTSLVAGDALHTLGQPIDVLRRFVQKSVYELGVNIIGKAQPHVVLRGDDRHRCCARGFLLQWRPIARLHLAQKPLGEIQCLLLIHGHRPSRVLCLQHQTAKAGGVVGPGEKTAE